MKKRITVDYDVDDDDDDDDDDGNDDNDELNLGNSSLKKFH